MRTTSGLGSFTGRGLSKSLGKLYPDETLTSYPKNLLLDYAGLLIHWSQVMYIRNKMEDFHCKYLSDDQMKELNPIIRQSVFEIFNYLSIASKKENDKEKAYAQDIINFQIQQIPDY